MLETDGHQAIDCSWMEAMPHLENHVFDVILLDLNLSGIKSHDLLAFLRTHFPSAVIVYGSSDTVGKARKRGASGYLVQPFSAAELRRVVAGIHPPEPTPFLPFPSTLHLARPERSLS